LGVTSGSCTVTGGATCGWAGSFNISDIVNLPAGSTITYDFFVTTDGGSAVDLVNAASVAATGYTESSPGNESQTDADQLLMFNPFPWGNIGTGKDSVTTILPSGSSITLALASPLIVGGHAGYDLIYYEMSAGSGILMDRVLLQVSDGYNWYTILNWGGGGADVNTNIDINVIGGSEDDNRDISAGSLHNVTGVAINADGVVPNNTYNYIRIYSPTGDSGDGCDVDAIEILP
jgi:hypothetical protein